MFMNTQQLCVISFLVYIWLYSHLVLHVFVVKLEMVNSYIHFVYFTSYNYMYNVHVYNYVFSFYYYIQVKAHACKLLWLSVYFVYLMKMFPSKSSHFVTILAKVTRHVWAIVTFVSLLTFFFNFVTFINCFPISSVNFTDKSFKVASS